jgi:hypothetical protein
VHFEIECKIKKMNTKKTSKKVVSLASKKLKDNSSSKTTKKQS